MRTYPFGSGLLKTGPQPEPGSSHAFRLFESGLRFVEDGERILQQAYCWQAFVTGQPKFLKTG